MASNIIQSTNFNNPNPNNNNFQGRKINATGFNLGKNNGSKPKVEVSRHQPFR